MEPTTEQINEGHKKLCAMEVQKTGYFQNIVIGDFALRFMRIIVSGQTFWEYVDFKRLGVGIRRDSGGVG